VSKQRRGKSVDARGLARRLSRYDIGPKPVRLPDRQVVVKGRGLGANRRKDGAPDPNPGEGRSRK
jgi:hypothetical protein